MREYVVVSAMAFDGPFHYVATITAGSAEAAADEAKAQDTAPEDIYVAVPERNWSSFQYEQETTTRRREGLVPAHVLPTHAEVEA